MINTLRLKTIEPLVLADIVESLGDPKEIPDLELKVVDMTFFEALDAYLKYNGIIGYTRDIIEAVDALRACEVKRD